MRFDSEASVGGPLPPFSSFSQPHALLMKNQNDQPNAPFGNLEGISFPSPPLLFSPTPRLPSPSALFSRPHVSASPCGTASRVPGGVDAAYAPVSAPAPPPSPSNHTSFLALLAAAAQMEPKKPENLPAENLPAENPPVENLPAENLPAERAVAPTAGTPRELVVRIANSPPTHELVARKTIKFSVMMTGDDAHLHGSLHLAAVLVDAKTLKSISSGLMEKKVKLKRDPASRPPQDAILQRIVPYRETDIEFQIVKGSAKKNIQNHVKFELRLYKGPVDDKNYEVMDSDFSSSYRVLTHSSQLGRAR